jgi:hypothetical protein
MFLTTYACSINVQAISYYPLYREASTIAYSYALTVLLSTLRSLSLLLSSLSFSLSLFSRNSTNTSFSSRDLVAALLSSCDPVDACSTYSQLHPLAYHSNPTKSPLDTICASLLYRSCRDTSRRDQPRSRPPGLLLGNLNMLSRLKPPCICPAQKRISNLPSCHSQLLLWFSRTSYSLSHCTQISKRCLLAGALGSESEYSDSSSAPASSELSSELSPHSFSEPSSDRCSSSSSFSPSLFRSDQARFSTPG